MTRLRVFAADDGDNPVLDTSDPKWIADALKRIGVRYERWPLRDTADADTDGVVGAQHVPHAAGRQFPEALDLARDGLQPFRDRLARLQLLQRIVVAEAERFDAPVALEGAELERLQRQRRNARDQFPLARRRDELRRIAQPLRPHCLVVE